MFEALGNLGDFVGGIGVVVTLVYLAFQVRQNTRALRTASRQDVVNGMRAHSRLLLEFDHTGAYALGLASYPDMPEAEKRTFGSILADLALFTQGAMALHEAGTLDDETWEAYFAFFLAHLAMPGGRAWWDDVGRPIFVERMVRVVDARLSTAGAIDPATLAAMQRGILGAVSAPRRAGGQP